MRLELLLNQTRCDIDLSLELLELKPREMRMLAPGVWLVLVLEGCLMVPSGGVRKACTAGTLALSVLDSAEACLGQSACRAEMLRLDQESWALLRAWIPWPHREGAPGPGPDLLKVRSLQLALEGAAFRDCCRSFQNLGLAGKTAARDLSGSFMALQLADLLLRLARARHEHTRLEASGVWTMEEAVAWVDSNYALEHSLNDLVAKCALNTTDFSRLFKARTGYPLFEYLNRVRIRHACTQLKRSDRSILEIALSVGYNNVSFFNRYFHRIMGITPSEFRSDTSQS